MFRSTTVGDIYDSTTYQPRKSVGYLLSRVRIEMLTALDRELEADRRLAPLELSAAQFIIIANLAAAEGPVSASDLCKGISYDAGAMTRMLDRLESKDRKSTRLNSSHLVISYAVFCLKKKKTDLYRRRSLAARGVRSVVPCPLADLGHGRILRSLPRPSRAPPGNSPPHSLQVSHLTTD